MAKLALNNVHKWFGNKVIIKAFNLDITSGEFIVLVGPSGCGKSTLLRLIAGLEDVTSGTILMNNEVINERDPAAREIAMVFQSYALYPHMNVYENMAFSLKMEKKLSQTELATRVQEAARILRLEAVLKQKPKELSGGQKQRVAIGRAFVRKPQIFLFDEPLSNLDAELRVEMRLEIAKLREAVHATMIYVTHDQVEAMTLADRIVILHDGLIQQVGTPQELYKHPANQFVAGFIGSPKMNFIPATLKAVTLAPAGNVTYSVQFKLDDVTTEVKLQTTAARLGELQLSAESLQTLIGKSIVCGCRPEHITATAQGKHKLTATKDALWLSSELEVSEYLGNLVYLYVKHPFVTTSAATLIVKVGETSNFNKHAQLTLQFPLTDLQLFTADGQTLR